MGNSKDEHGVKTAELIVDCSNLKVPIKTNDTLDSYVKVTVKCDVKCSMAQQTTYTRLMESALKDEFGYGVGNKTLLDSYWARARRIAATYARFFLEEEIGCQKPKGIDKNGKTVELDIDLTGRFYWMALGAYAVKTVACMFDKWQIKCVSVLAKDLAMNEVYEGLAKGNFWLFMDIGSWHHLYLLSNTATPNSDGVYTGYDKNFIPCRDIKSTDVLCDVPKDVVKNKLPWADELDKIGNLARPKRLLGVLENGMSDVYETEKLLIVQDDMEKIQKFQLSHLLNIAKHEQGNILQPLIYLDPFNPPPEDEFVFDELKVDSHTTAELKMKTTADIFDEEYVYTPNEEPHAVMQDWLQLMRAPIVSMGMPKVQVRLENECNDIWLVDDIRGIKTKIVDWIENNQKPSDEEIVSTPKDERHIELDNYKVRMEWIEEAAYKFDDLYKKYPQYVKDDLKVIAGWKDEDDQFEDATAVTKIY